MNRLVPLQSVQAFIFLILLDMMQFEVEVNNLTNVSHMSIPQVDEHDSKKYCEYRAAHS